MGGIKYHAINSRQKNKKIFIWEELPTSIVQGIIIVSGT